jgi:hypothetical protein
MRTPPLLLVVGSLAGLLAVAAGRDRLAERERAIHALDRLAFGPRPGDVERVAATGVDRWIDQQLHPERLAEDPAIEPRLPGQDVLSLSNGELIARFEVPIREARKKVVAERKTRENGSAEANRDDADAEARVRRLVPRRTVRRGSSPT